MSREGTGHQGAREVSNESAVESMRIWWLASASAKKFRSPIEEGGRN